MMCTGFFRIVISGLALTALTGGAQDKSGVARGQSNSPPPTITVRSQLVVLDVVVTDKKGSLVHRNDLTKDDFQVFEDGVPQSVRTLDAPSAHRMPVADLPIVNSAADLKRIGEAPVAILVLDELNSQFQDMSFARQMLVKYLETQPVVLHQPTAIMIASNTSFEQVHDYTQNRDALIEIVKKHMPEYPWRMANSGNSGAGAVERMAQNLAALQMLAQSSTGTPGRKNVIWVGNGYPSANFVGMPQDEVDTIEAAYRRCLARLLAARITMYTINPMAGSTATVEVDDLADINQTGVEVGPDPFGKGSISFQDYARETGGIAYVGRNDLNNVIGEGIAKGDEYYTLSYAPTNRIEDPARYRSIRIVMKDKTLRATTRDGYYQDVSADLNSVLDKSMSDKQVRANLQLDLSSALTNEISYNGLDVTVTTDGKDEYTLHVAEKGIAWSTPDQEGKQHAEATVTAAWYDAKNKVKPVGHIIDEQTSLRGASTDGATYKLTTHLPFGTTRLRFVVRDAIDGQMGTFDITKF
jgi:VWFA-related protein